jgi:hypothetical protein
VTEAYYRGLSSFAALAAGALRKGGYLAVVLGQPGSNAYRDADAAGHLDEALRVRGFERIWEKNRMIHWHRNHGYARLKEERVLVYLNT